MFDKTLSDRIEAALNKTTITDAYYYTLRGMQDAARGDDMDWDVGVATQYTAEGDARQRAYRMGYKIGENLCSVALSARKEA